MAPLAAATAAATDDELAALVALSDLPGMGPGRLRALLQGAGAADAWAALVADHLAPTPELAGASTGADLGRLVAGWVAAAREADPAGSLARHRAFGATVLSPADPRWPFTADPDPPAILFCLGDVDLLERRPKVGVVGTRRCSSYGVEVAGRFGAALAAAGVPVVSGLAAGIDGAAHVGALSVDGGAPPVGVVATGLDRVYPRGHQQLWRRVATDGLLLTEVPLGTPPARWRFPARNRIIAGLSSVVVVVESAVRGGALHTVDEAERRDVPVLAVPGPITSPCSVGTNRLLADGAAPACDVDDLLLAAGLDPRAGAAAGRSPTNPEPTGAAALLLDAVGWRPSTLDQVVLRSGLALAEAANGLAALERDGWLAADGGWWERRR